MEQQARTDTESLNGDSDSDSGGQAQADDGENGPEPRQGADGEEAHENLKVKFIVGVGAQQRCFVDDYSLLHYNSLSNIATSRGKRNSEGQLLIILPEWNPDKFGEMLKYIRRQKEIEEQRPLSLTLECLRHATVMKWDTKEILRYEFQLKAALGKDNGENAIKILCELAEEVQPNLTLQRLREKALGILQRKPISGEVLKTEGIYSLPWALCLTILTAVYSGPGPLTAKQFLEFATIWAKQRIRAKKDEEDPQEEIPINVEEILAELGTEVWAEYTRRSLQENENDMRRQHPVATVSMKPQTEPDLLLHEHDHSYSGPNAGDGVGESSSTRPVSPVSPKVNGIFGNQNQDGSEGEQNTNTNSSNEDSESDDSSPPILSLQSTVQNMIQNFHGPIQNQSENQKNEEAGPGPTNVAFCGSSSLSSSEFDGNLHHQQQPTPPPPLLLPVTPQSSMPMPSSSQPLLTDEERRFLKKNRHDNPSRILDSLKTKLKSNAVASICYSDMSSSASGHSLSHTVNDQRQILITLKVPLILSRANTNLYFPMLMPDIRQFHLNYLFDGDSLQDFFSFLKNLDIKRLLFFRTGVYHPPEPGKPAYYLLNFSKSKPININIEMNGVTILKILHSDSGSGFLSIFRLERFSGWILQGEPIGPCPNILRKLHLAEIRLPSIPTTNLYQLVHLTLRNVKELTDETLKSLLSPCKNLKGLSISVSDNNDNTLDLDLGSLNSLPHLRKLYVEGIKLNFQILVRGYWGAAEREADSKKLDKLEELYAINCQFRGAFIVPIVEMRNVEHLNLLAIAFPRLKVFEIYNNVDLTMFEALKDIPSVKSMIVWGLVFPNTKTDPLFTTTRQRRSCSKLSARIRTWFKSVHRFTNPVTLYNTDNVPINFEGIKRDSQLQDQSQSQGQSGSTGKENNWEGNRLMDSKLLYHNGMTIQDFNFQMSDCNQFYRDVQTMERMEA